ncbi:MULTISPECIES: helix-turn-helix domain-containing protein [Saccharomonospora]|uniref:helix-turn-helix domain-containing protein n=1 Tax=Saccharomonospora TaxID=1851 RepID=UPI00022DF86D|nr:MULTISPECIES: helix-turn-helix domain-containing protein [Saccharomonospora]
MGARKLLTSREVADELGLSARTIARYARDGSLVPTIVTPGGQYRWDLDDVKRQMREQWERQRDERP